MESSSTTSGAATTTSVSGTGLLDTGLTTSGLTFAETEDPGGCGFLCPPDATHPEAQCSPAEQDCPEGEKCVWYAPSGGQGRGSAARCIAVTGDIEPYQPCTLPTGIGPGITDDCGPDSFCLEVYGSADHGFCAPFVDGPSYDCEAYPGASAAVENGSDFPAACLHYDCHPFVPDSCPPSMQCTFYPAFLYGTNMCWFVPEQADLPLGSECDFGECGEGKLCVPAEWTSGCTGERCCTQWCDVNVPACEDPAAACELFPVWNSGGILEFDWLGACVLPGSFG